MNTVGLNFLYNTLSSAFECLKSVFLSQLGYVFVPLIVFAFVGLTIRRFIHL